MSAPKAWLTTVVTHLSVDHLRSARVRRELYVGTWLPEPVLADPSPAADERQQLALHPVTVNGEPGLLALDASGGVVSVAALAIDGGAIVAVRSVANLAKLAHISSTILPSLPPALKRS